MLSFDWSICFWKGILPHALLSRLFSAYHFLSPHSTSEEHSSCAHTIAHVLAMADLDRYVILTAKTIQRFPFMSVTSSFEITLHNDTGLITETMKKWQGAVNTLPPVHVSHFFLSRGHFVQQCLDDFFFLCLLLLSQNCKQILSWKMTLSAGVIEAYFVAWNLGIEADLSSDRLQSI